MWLKKLTNEQKCANILIRPKGREINMLNFNKLNLEKLNEMFTEEHLEELRMVANKERQIEERKKHQQVYNATGIKGYCRDYICQEKFSETVYTRSAYMRYNDYEKAFLASNMVFPNSEKFVDLLYNSCTAQKYKINYSVIESYIFCLKWLKKYQGNEKNRNYQKISKYTEYYSKVLVNIFTTQIGNIHLETIINKINEILSLEPTLLKSFDNDDIDKTRK